MGTASTQLPALVDHQISFTSPRHKFTAFSGGRRRAGSNSDPKLFLSLSMQQGTPTAAWGKVTEG